MDPEMLQRLTKVETHVELMAPKVTMIYEMMLEQRGEKKFKKSLWDMARGSKAIMASLIAVAGYFLTAFMHK